MTNLGKSEDEFACSIAEAFGYLPVPPLFLPPLDELTKYPATEQLLTYRESRILCRELWNLATNTHKYRSKAKCPPNSRLVTAVLHMGYVHNSYPVAYKHTHMPTVLLLHTVALKAGFLALRHFPAEYRRAMASLAALRVWPDCPWSTFAINFYTKHDTDLSCGMRIHRDPRDLLCVIVILGEYGGGELVVVPKKQKVVGANGLGVAIDSRHDYHGVHPVLWGRRISISLYFQIQFQNCLLKPLKTISERDVLDKFM
jgi:hypothetical protein